MFLRKAQRGAATLGLVTGFLASSTEKPLEEAGGREEEREETALLSKTEVSGRNGLDEGTCLEKGEAALICGDHC
jgi:hypothetical protein